MNFSFKNITKDAFLTIVGVLLSVAITLAGLVLLYQEKINISELGAFFALVLPILFGFALAGRNKPNE